MKLVNSTSKSKNLQKRNQVSILTEDLTPLILRKYYYIAIQNQDSKRTFP